MQRKFIRALIGATLVLGLVPAAAGAATYVTLRVEGKSKALLAPKRVKIGSGTFQKHGHTCPADSAAGALQSATHGRWNGKFFSSLNDYEINSIFGESVGDSTKYYWELFANNVSATTGACGLKPHHNEQLMFAVVSDKDANDYPLAIRSAPRDDTVGHAFKVQVVYYNARGHRHALSGAKVSGKGIQSVVTNSHGVAEVTPSSAGKLVLNASHAASNGTGYIRAAAVAVRVTA